MRSERLEPYRPAVDHRRPGRTTTPKFVDKVYCVYIAEDEDALREHADRVGVPVTSISAVTSVLDPTTGE
jgi:hypothetical protein